MATNPVLATTAVGDRPLHPKVGPSWVWGANSGDGTGDLFDKGTNRTVGDPIEVGRGITRIGVGFDAVWVVNPVPGTLTRIEAVAR